MVGTARWGPAVLGRFQTVIGQPDKATGDAEIPAGIGDWTEPCRWSSPDFRVRVLVLAVTVLFTGCHHACFQIRYYLILYILYAVGVGTSTVLHSSMYIA